MRMHEMPPKTPETIAADDSAVPPRREYKRKWQEAKRRSLNVKPVKIAPCGTEAAYRRHLRNSEPIDDACLKAHRETARAARNRRAKIAADQAKSAADQASRQRRTTVAADQATTGPQRRRRKAA